MYIVRATAREILSLNILPLSAYISASVYTFINVFKRIHAPFNEVLNVISALSGANQYLFPLKDVTGVLYILFSFLLFFFN